MPDIAPLVLIIAVIIGYLAADLYQNKKHK